jgi:proteic killer suppression protein
MILNFKDKGSRDLAYGENSKEARRKLPVKLHGRAKIWLALLDATSSLAALSSPGLGLEKLSGDRKGQWSIRINCQYRICFYCENGEFSNVEIVDYH